MSHFFFKKSIVDTCPEAVLYTKGARRKKQPCGENRELLRLRAAANLKVMPPAAGANFCRQPTCTGNVSLRAMCNSWAKLCVCDPPSCSQLATTEAQQSDKDGPQRVDSDLPMERWGRQKRPANTRPRQGRGRSLPGEGPAPGVSAAGAERAAAPPEPVSGRAGRMAASVSSID